MKFRILGADRQTGEDIEIIIEARDEVDAATIAGRRNVLVNEVSVYKEPRTPAPAKAAVKQPARQVKQCPKCKEWINKGATKCPHCRSQQPAPPWSYAVGLLLIAVPAIWCCGQCSPSDKPSKLDKPTDSRKERIEQQFSPWDGSHRGLTRAIKDAMNDPRSYEHVETVYRDEGSRLWVRTTFRGKNAFGGVVKNWTEARVDLDGNVLEILSQGP